MSLLLMTVPQAIFFAEEALLLGTVYSEKEESDF